MKERWAERLAGPAVTRGLIVLNVLVTLVFVWLNRNGHGSDYDTYKALAESLGHGKYSLWYWLPADIPDTIRTPGYPMFLYPLLVLTGAEWPVVLAQLILFGLAMRFMVLTMRHMGGTLAVNLFLLLLLPSFNLAWYVPQFGAETPMLFSMCAWLYVQVVWKDEGWRKPVVQALLLAVAFQMRPAVMLFPFVWVAWQAVSRRDRRTLLSGAIHLGVFVLTLIPYGLWNQRHHGVFTVTPLESGGGVMHIGWWSDKIPGHREMRYWGNTTSLELYQFTPADQVEGNWAAFNREWDHIDSAIAPLLVARDSLMMAEWHVHGELFHTYSAGYVLARERMLKHLVWQHSLEEPGYTLCTKAYTFLRLWITGIQRDQWATASGSGKIKLLYPFLLTVFIFLAALILTPLVLIKRWRRLPDLMPLLLPLLYFGLIHVPFCIQSRYTIPVRPMLLGLVALGLATWLQRRLSSKGSA